MCYFISVKKKIKNKCISHTHTPERIYTKMQIIAHGRKRAIFALASVLLQVFGVFSINHILFTLHKILC